MTNDELQALMMDPRYWREQDPEVVRVVREEFKRISNAPLKN